jgi:DNA-binding NtrC family response regulator
MDGIATREHGEIRLLTSGNTNPTPDVATSQSKIDDLKRLALTFLHEVQSLCEVPSLDIKQGINFYDVVRRFEIELIERALSYTGGHQVRAARLLNMKVTTLNSKIKHYNIDLNVPLGGYSVLPAPAENGARKQA